MDPQGRESSKVMLYAYLNAANETGLLNPIDEAIRECKVPGAGGWRKLDELPYDFPKTAEHPSGKGRPSCDRHERAVAANPHGLHRVEQSDGSLAEATSVLSEIERHWREFSDQGRRVLGIAYREFSSGQRIAREERKRHGVFGIHRAVRSPSFPCCLSRSC